MRRLPLVSGDVTAMLKDTDPLAAMTETLHRQRAAFLRDGPPTRTERRRDLRRLRAIVLEHRCAIDADFGHRSRHETDLMELVGVVQAIDYLTRNLHRFMRTEKRHVSLIYQGGRAHVTYQPKGVIGVMAPWNYPFSLVMIPLATAIAAGNRVMIKPSETTPRTSALIRMMLAEAFGDEKVAVVLGGPDVGTAFSRLPFDHLLFTGSTSVGRHIMAAASENLVPVTLELGGKSPVVVARGHVSDNAMNSIVFGKLSNAGQTCVAPDYALVHENDLEAFITSWDRAVTRSYPDGPTSADYSSIVNDHHYTRLTGLIDEARQRGARVIEVGARPDAARKRTLTPTLVIGAEDDLAVMKEEIFGPILPVRTYRTMDDAIDFINARPRPLALYYFGARDADCARLLARTTSGNVGINNTMIHVAQDDLPFGGIGASGIGAYHGIEGFRTMSHARGVFIQSRWNLPALLRAPFGRLADIALRATLGKSRRHV